jgi:hypothetical protein
MRPTLPSVPPQPDPEPNAPPRHEFWVSLLPAVLSGSVVTSLGGAASANSHPASPAEARGLAPETPPRSRCPPLLPPPTLQRQLASLIALSFTAAQQVQQVRQV